MQTEAVATVGSTPDTTNPYFHILVDPPSIPLLDEIKKPPAAGMFIGQGILNSDKTIANYTAQYGAAAAAAITNNPAAVQAAADPSLKLHGAEVLAKTLTAAQFKAAIPLYYIMYVLGHGTTGITSMPNTTPVPTPFQGIQFDETPPITVGPTDVTNNNVSHSYNLVFLNACASADTSTASVPINDEDGNPIIGSPFTNQVSAMYTAFKCKSYVGWSQVTDLGKMTLGGVTFFQSLTPSKPTNPAQTVRQAIKSTMDALNGNGINYTVDDSEGLPVADTSQLLVPNPGGGSYTADQLAIPPSPP